MDSVRRRRLPNHNSILPAFGRMPNGMSGYGRFVNRTSVDKSARQGMPPGDIGLVVAPTQIGRGLIDNRWKIDQAKRREFRFNSQASQFIEALIEPPLQVIEAFPHRSNFARKHLLNFFATGSNELQPKTKLTNRPRMSHHVVRNFSDKRQHEICFVHTEPALRHSLIHPLAGSSRFAPGVL